MIDLTYRVHLKINNFSSSQCNDDLKSTIITELLQHKNKKIRLYVTNATHRTKVDVFFAAVVLFFIIVVIIWLSLLLLSSQCRPAAL